MSKKIPYMLRAAMAHVAGDKDAHAQEIQKGATAIGQALNSLIAQYSRLDYPILVAVMRTHAEALYMASEAGQKADADVITNAIDCITIDMAKLREQQGEN